MKNILILTGFTFILAAAHQPVEDMSASAATVFQPGVTGGSDKLSISLSTRTA